MTESTKLYKILGLNAEPINGGSRTWNTNGKWMPFIEDIEPCERGYHLCAEIIPEEKPRHEIRGNHVSIL